jgi:S-(hydroxymethyl)glutathione dehydrogenase/alcohol dehydrogenase
LEPGADSIWSAWQGPTSRGLNIVSAIGGQKHVQGVSFGSTNAKSDIPMYAELYLQGRMNLDDLVSKKISLREVNDGYAALKDGSLNRVVVTSF